MSHQLVLDENADSGLGNFLQLPLTELQKSQSVFPGTSLSIFERLPGASLFDLY